MQLKRWALALALTAGALGMGQAEPLRVAQLYVAGTIIDAPALGYRLMVPPGYQAQLGPSDEAPGVVLNLGKLQSNSTIQVSVLPNAPTNALQIAFPAKLRVGQLEAVLSAPPTGTEVQLARYSLPGDAVLTRIATVQTAKGGGTPTRLTLMVINFPDQNDLAQQLLSAVLQLTVLVPVDPVPAQLWAKRLEVAQVATFVSIQRTSGAPQTFMGLCEGGGYALTQGLADGAFSSGSKGQVTIVPLSSRQVALKLTNAAGVSLGSVEVDDESPQSIELSLQLNAPPTDDDYLVLRSANTEFTHKATGIERWCGAPGSR